MKIAIIGGSGKSGSLITKEAISRGHDVTAIVRNTSKITESKVTVLEKDLFCLTFDDLKEYDAVIDAFGTWTPESLNLHGTSLKHLSDILSGKPNRLIVIGGAGSLYINSEHTQRLVDSPDFPDIYKPVANQMASALDELRKRTDVQWTYISPAAIFAYEGERIGQYTRGGEELLVNSKGESKISYADYAIAVVDEVENATHIQKRFTVVSE